MISTVKRNVISQGSRCSSKIRAKNNLWYILPLSLSLSCFFYGFPSKKNVLWASFSNPKDQKICASFSLIFFCVYHASYNKIGNLHFFFTCFVASGIVGKY